MKFRPQAVLEAMQARLFWIGTGMVTAIIVAFAVAIGLRSLDRKALLESQTQQLLQIQDEADRWMRTFQPASDEEMQAWRKSEGDVRTLAVKAGDRADLLQLVARRAENVGLSDVLVRFEGADTISPAPPRQVGEFLFEMGPTTLVVDFQADFTTLLSFIGALPAQVDVRRLDLSRVGEGVRARFLLITFVNAGGEQANAAVQATGSGGSGSGGSAGLRVLGTGPGGVESVGRGVAAS